MIKPLRDVLQFQVSVQGSRTGEFVAVVEAGSAVEAAHGVLARFGLVLQEDTRPSSRRRGVRHWPGSGLRRSREKPLTSRT